VHCPATLLWALGDDLKDLYPDPLEPWRPWCPQITGRGLEGGHHLAEEPPEAVVAALREALD
jgi:haloacetate dehalogenase